MIRIPPGLSRVLIVEDDVIQAELLASTLIDAGAGEVRRCTTAAEALAELNLFSPSLLILDVHLGDSPDGWQMAELVQLLYARMPLLVFATGSPERIPEAIRNLGILAVKPYDAVELVEQIRVRALSPIQAGWRALFQRARGAP